MPPYAAQVTMATTVKGKTEEFSNVWHYDYGFLPDTESGWVELLDQIVAAMRPLFSTQVNFVRGRVHGPTHLSKVEDIMRTVKDFTQPMAGLGATTAMSPELAIVADVYVGRGPKGGKQFLRKYLHTCGLLGGTTSGQREGRDPLVAASKDPVIAALNTLKTVSIGGQALNVCTPTGKHLPLASTWTVNSYLHTRQFRRGRKRKVS